MPISDRGHERAAAMATLIVTVKVCDVDREAWLADVLRRMTDHRTARLDELLPWNWTPAAGAQRRWRTFALERHSGPKLGITQGSRSANLGLIGPYSITSSAPARSDCAIVRPSALAVLRFIAN